MLTIPQLLRFMVSQGASDLHLSAGEAPMMRVNGEMYRVDAPVMTPEETHRLIFDCMNDAQRRGFQEKLEADFAFALDETLRFRVNTFVQNRGEGAVFRSIQHKIPRFEDLGLPQVVRALCDEEKGLVLVTGPTGSGKSHTLAAMIHHINQTRSCHILTMEDPIEFIHCDDRAHITQREIGRDCLEFSRALKRALRQDPDVILVGEMRDLETISLALTAAETGHLVFATLHTTSACTTPDRIIDVFSPQQQGQIRQQLADSLRGIMAQILVPKAKGGGLALVQEVLVATDAARALIREGKSAQLHNIMQTSANDGMTTLEMSLNGLVDKGVVTYETAVAKANVPSQIRAPQSRRGTPR
jgi:twitching motility protein PilT